MRIASLFRSARAKAFTVLGCFAMLMGVGASVGLVSLTQDNEVVETKADDTTLWSLVGSDFNSFGTPQTVSAITLGGTNYYYITVTLTANSTFRFKKTNDNDWNYTIGYSNLSDSSYTGFDSAWFGNANNDNNFKTLTAGTYTFLFASTFEGYGDKKYGIYCFQGSPNQTYTLNTNAHWDGTINCYGWSGVSQSGCLVKDATTWAAWGGDDMTRTSSSDYLYTITYAIPPHNIIFNCGGDDSKKTGTLTPSTTQVYNLSGDTTGSWSASRTYVAKIKANFFKGSASQGTADLAWQYPTAGSSFAAPETSAEGTYPTSYGYNGTTYTFSAWYADEDCTVAFTTIASVSSNFTLYAKYIDQNKYTLTYRYVLNGEYLSGWGTGSITDIASGTYYSDVTEPFVYGMGFEGWYSNSACTNGLSGMVLNSAEVYAKFTSLSTNRLLYIALSGDAYTYVSGSGSNIYCHYANATNSATNVPVQHISAVTSTHLYAFSVPADCTEFQIHQGNRTEGLRTILYDLDDAGSDNLLICTGDYDSENKGYTGTWSDCYFQFQTCSSNFGEGATITRTDMGEPTNLSTGNEAECLGFAAAFKYYFRVAIVVDGGETIVTTVDSSADGTTVLATYSDGTNRFRSATSAETTAEKTSFSVNVYYKGGTIYLVDATSIDQGGYLYISSTSALTDIRITVTFTSTSGSEVSPFSSSKLSTVTNAVNTTTLTFNSVAGMIRIPIYNLRGGETPNVSETEYTVTFNSNSSIAVPIVTSGASYYMSSLAGSISAANAIQAQAAAAAGDIDAMIKNVSSKSVCDMDPSIASGLVTAYEAVAEDETGKSLLDGSTINTFSKVSAYNESGNGYLDMISDGTKSAISLPNIYLQLCKRANVTPSISYASLIGYKVDPTSNQSPLTLTLWIVLGAGILGMGAIGTAYFISKKRKKYQA